MRKDNRLVSYTEFAVEVMDKDNHFVTQLEVFKTYEEACRYVEWFDLGTLDDGEWLSIIFIDYDENDNEVEFGTVC